MGRALAPGSQWGGALILAQSLVLIRRRAQCQRGHLQSLMPSFFTREMEDPRQGHTAPQGQSQKSAFLAPDPVSFALLDTMVINCRLLGQKCIPVPTA